MTADLGSYSTMAKVWSDKMKSFKIKDIDYPPSYEKLINLGLTDFECWYILEQEVTGQKYDGLQKRYPQRQLIPFAQRVDNDVRKDLKS